MTLSPVVTSHWLILERTNPVVNPVVVSQKCIFCVLQNMSCKYDMVRSELLRGNMKPLESINTQMKGKIHKSF